jgi:NAD(P)-dependent dehydrogenase (short-subunit alcohol dehydrogenase family)
MEVLALILLVCYYGYTAPAGSVAKWMSDGVMVVPAPLASPVTAAQGRFAYGASKVAVIGLTQLVAKDLWRRRYVATSSRRAG